MKVTVVENNERKELEIPNCAKAEKLRFRQEQLRNIDDSEMGRWDSDSIGDKLCELAYHFLTNCLKCDKIENEANQASVRCKDAEWILNNDD